MESFAACRGSVFAFSPSGTGKGGFYQIQPAITGDGESPILINGVESNDTDIVAPVVTLNKNKILYTFGEDFGQIAVHGTVLLGSASGSGGGSLNKVVEFFKQNRVSANQGMISVSLPGGGGYKMFLTGLTISVPDQQYHIQQFALIGLIAEAK